MRSLSRRLWLAVAMVSLIAGITATTITGADAEQPKLPPACKNNPVTVKEFKRFSQKVWSATWERGDPPKKIKRAQRKKLKCAVGPESQKKMQKRWRKEKHRYFHFRKHCRSGMKVEGRVSFYSGGMTGDGIHNASEPGIAIRDTSTYGEYFRVTVGGRTATLMHFDWGPASWTGRAIDITEAGVAQLGGVTTDEWGSAKMIPSDCL